MYFVFKQLPPLFTNKFYLTCIIRLYHTFFGFLTLHLLSVICCNYLDDVTVKQLFYYQCRSIVIILQNLKILLWSQLDSFLCRKGGKPMNIVKYWYILHFFTEYSVEGAQIVWHIILNMWVCNPFYDRTIIRCKICEKQGISVRKVSTVLLYWWKNYFTLCMGFRIFGKVYNIVYFLAVFQAFLRKHMKCYCFLGLKISV